MSASGLYMLPSQEEAAPHKDSTPPHSWMSSQTHLSRWRATETFPPPQYNFKCLLFGQPTTSKGKTICFLIFKWSQLLLFTSLHMAHCYPQSLDPAVSWQDQSRTACYFTGTAQDLVPLQFFVSPSWWTHELMMAVVWKIDHFMKKIIHNKLQMFRKHFSIPWVWLESSAVNFRLGVYIN